jgi:hypothetical protein
MAEPAYISNNPPDDIEVLRDLLADKHRTLLDRAQSLIDARSRQPEITDDIIAGKVSDYIKLVSAAIKSAEAERTATKEPYLAAGRAVDTFFKSKVVEPLDAVKRETERKLTAYLQAKEAERRREAEAEAARLKAEAEAELAKATENLDAAVAKENEAVAAAETAVAKPAELSRTRGEIGSVASLRQVWKGELVDRAALDLDALRPYIPAAAIETAINGFVKAGGRELRGARIYQHTSATVR